MDDIKISDVINFLEQFAHPFYQENYDNAGLNVGDADQKLTRGLICLDVTDSILDEAIAAGANLIVSHHPLIFHPIKQLTGTNRVERLVMKAIEHHICLYSMHTNLDNIRMGVNQRFADLLELQDTSILCPADNQLLKLAVTVPNHYAQIVRDAIFSAGGGCIGNYDCCSFNQTGFGTFKAGKHTRPFVGKQGEIHREEETKIEVIFPKYLKNKIIAALKEKHPYEEIAYDLLVLANKNPLAGSGLIGELKEKMTFENFMLFLKEKMQLKCVKCSNVKGKMVKKVAICGGSGAFLIPYAIEQHADVFVSSEFHHHDFLDNLDRLPIADIGHYESEIQTKMLIFEKLNEKFSNFAVSKQEVNPADYL